MGRKEDQMAEVLALAARMERKLAARYLEAIERLREHDVDWATIKENLTVGRPDLAIAAVSNALINNGFAGFSHTLSEAFIAGGELAATHVPIFTSNAGLQMQQTGATLNVVFDAVNPAVSGVMQEYKMQLISQISDDLRLQIREIISRNILEGNNPKTAAQQIVDELKGSFGLTSKQEAAVMRYRRALEEGNKDALARALRDKRFDSSVLSSIQNQKPLPKEKIDQMVQRYRERYLKHRATMIARTEAMRALSIAESQLWHNMVDEGKVDANKVRRFWFYTHDSRTRDWHKTIPAMNKDGVGLNEYFKTEHGPLLFPCDPKGKASNIINCRCTIFTRIVG